jgi:hypothetical protein
MITDTKRPRGRPKKQKMILDTSMTVEEARDQRIIADAKEKVYKAEIQRIKAMEASKAVIETKAVTGLVTDVFTKLKTILYSASNQLPARIAGKEHAEISQIMYEFIDQSLERCIKDFDQKLSNIKVDDEHEDIEEETITDE